MKARIYIIYCLDPNIFRVTLPWLTQITTQKCFLKKKKKSVLSVIMVKLRNWVQSTSCFQGTPVLRVMGSSEGEAQTSSAKSEAGGRGVEEEVNSTKVENQRVDRLEMRQKG